MYRQHRNPHVPYTSLPTRRSSDLCAGAGRILGQCALPASTEEWLVAKSTLIGGFHAVVAALEDAHDKPFEILLADTRNDERARRVQALAKQFEVRVRVVPRSDLDLKEIGRASCREGVCK